jgi:hypothetical protein
MSRRERTLLIVLGVIVLAVGGFFLFTMLGGEEEQQAAPTPVTSPLPATPGTEAGEAPSEPPNMFRFFGGRDPFVPLIVAEAGGAGVGTAPAEIAGGEAPPVEPAPEGAEQAEAPNQSVTVDGQTVTLIDIVDSDTAQVEVDGRTVTVDEGEEFAQNFELVSVEGNCARFLFGDESFTLCEGGAPK